MTTDPTATEGAAKDAGALYVGDVRPGCGPLCDDDCEAHPIPPYGGRRLCAHADGDAPMHWLEPGERCTATTEAAVPGADNEETAMPDDLTVTLTPQQQDLIGDALASMLANGRGLRRAEVEDLCRETGLYVLVDG